jgi:Toastrack DUF4097
MRRTLWVLALLLGLAGPAFAFDQVFDHTYSLPSGGSFTLENVNGSVQVEGWERNQVEVQAVKTARRNQADLDRVQIEVENRSGNVTVRTRYPQDSGVDVQVEFRVHVPYRVLLGEVATVNGSVRVSNIEGAGRIRSTNGNVEVLDSAGRFSARTTNGNVRLELRRLTDGEPMALETVNGSIVLALPPDAQANLNIRSMNGDFHSDLPVEARGSLSTRAFRGKIGSGGGEITIRTINGWIRLVQERPSI